MTGPNAPTPTPGVPPGQKGDGKSGSALAGLGLQFAVAIVACVLVGNWVDKRYGTGPWGVLIGAAVGFAAGFHSIFRAAKADDARYGSGNNTDSKGK